jgi:hypothetical protein
VITLACLVSSLAGPGESVKDVNTRAAVGEERFPDAEHHRRQRTVALPAVM